MQGPRLGAFSPGAEAPNPQTGERQLGPSGSRGWPARAPSARGRRGPRRPGRCVSGHRGPAPPSPPGARARRSRYLGNRGASSVRASTVSPRHFQTALTLEPVALAEGASEGDECKRRCGRRWRTRRPELRVRRASGAEGRAGPAAALSSSPSGSSPRAGPGRRQRPRGWEDVGPGWAGGARAPSHRPASVRTRGPSCKPELGRELDPARRGASA
ncbi:hypothetical protein GHT09_005513 [Marmota monax]|uniref:Uncharacterized protein n=1 Tax=Marmota monax TaxID=9995 RepID=A0A834QUK4_MARMO|nr:hypothetical protein GHT09_005513 [Marmota monax]